MKQFLNKTKTILEKHKFYLDKESLKLAIFEGYVNFLTVSVISLGFLFIIAIFKGFTMRIGNRKHSQAEAVALLQRDDSQTNVRDDNKVNDTVVELFNTLLDQLKMNIRAVDELFPNLSELFVSINSMSTFPDDHDAKVKVKAWYDKLHGMAAFEEISDETAQQMISDLQTAYNGFQEFSPDTG